MPPTSPARARGLALRRAGAGVCWLQVLLLFSAAGTTRAASCTVQAPVRGAQAGDGCVFPFVYKGDTYRECTTAGTTAPTITALLEKGYCSDWLYTTGTRSGGYDVKSSTPEDCWARCRAKLPGTTSFYTKGNQCGCSATTSGACKVTKATGYTSFVVNPRSPVLWCATTKNYDTDPDSKWGACSEGCPGTPAQTVGPRTRVRALQQCPRNKPASSLRPPTPPLD